MFLCKVFSHMFGSQWWHYPHLKNPVKGWGFQGLWVNAHPHSLSQILNKKHFTLPHWFSHHLSHPPLSFSISHITNFSPIVCFCILKCIQYFLKFLLLCLWLFSCRRCLTDWSYCVYDMILINHVGIGIECISEAPEHTSCTPTRVEDDVQSILHRQTRQMSWNACFLQPRGDYKYSKWICTLWRRPTCFVYSVSSKVALGET